MVLSSRGLMNGLITPGPLARESTRLSRVRRRTHPSRLILRAGRLKLSGEDVGLCDASGLEELVIAR